MNNQKSKSEKIFNWFLFFSALIGLTIMFLEVFFKLTSTYRTPEYAEKIVFPFYFTFQSNVLGLAFGIIAVFGLIKNKKWNYNIRIFAAVNLTLTFIVYWTVLLPTAGAPDGIVSWFANMFIHCITPILTVICFVFYVRRETIKFVTWKKSLLHILYPLVWFIIAIILYYAGGAKKDAYAIYGFLEFEQNAVWFSIMMVFAIGISYYGLTYLAIWSLGKNFSKKELLNQ